MTVVPHGLVTPTLHQVVGRGRLRAVLAMFGPAFVAAVAYVDPGNFSTNFTAGARHGYALVWVVVLANLMAMPVQFLSAKVGVVTGRSLPEVCRDEFGPTARRTLWLQAELVAIATDLAEFVGAAVGLYLVFGISPLAAGVVTAAASFAVLALQRRGARPFERAVFFLLLLVVGGFVVQLLGAGVAVQDVAGGLVPSLPDSGSLYLAAGIIGATMMPHVVYLHSAMTARRVRCVDDADRRRVLRFERWDVVVALGVAGLINLSMIVVAARLFHGSPTAGDGALDSVHDGLATTLGGGAALAFAVALVASGISSSSVGTYSGQVVMAGFIRRRIPLLVRRGVTMAPALVVLALGVEPTAVLNFSQVVLSFGIPFALVPLLLVAGNRRVMGAFVLTRPVKAVMVTVVVLVVALNAALLASSLVG